MTFTNERFNTTIFEENTDEPERIIIISCEGRNTEPEYFNTIKEKLADEISSLVEVKIVPKDDNRSEPEDVVCNLDKYLEDEYDYKGDHDQMWVVWDREKVDSRKLKILKQLPACVEKNYFVALVNPLFEFWLLLHIVDITEYDNTTLYNNDWETAAKNRRYIDKELSNILTNGYSKKKNKFNKDIVTLENVTKAIEQEKLFENDINNIIDKLGSNIGMLVSEILTKR